MKRMLLLNVDYKPFTFYLFLHLSGSHDDEDAEDIADEQDYLLAEFKSPAQISDELVTLSLLPPSRWQNLLNLDIIKVDRSCLYSVT